MWGESFLQYLKRLFEMGNNVSGPYSVATLWAAKAKQRYRDPSRHVWYHDTVEPALPGFSLPAKVTMSTAMSMSMQADAPLALRPLLSFTRGRVHVTLNSWILVTAGGVSVVGRVSEMLQLNVLRMGYALSSVVRMLVVDVVSSVVDAHGYITLNAAGSGQCMYVSLESAQISCLSCERRDSHLIFSCE